MRTLILMGALFLIGLVGRAGATNEYYTLSSPLTSAACHYGYGNGAVSIPCDGNLTVSGWFETNGFGRSYFGCGPSSCSNYDPLIIDGLLTITYHPSNPALTPSWGAIQQEPFPDGSFESGVVATSKGLFCVKGCDISNTDASPSEVFVDMNKASGAASYLVPLTVNGQWEEFVFATALPKNGLVATYAGTSLPTGAPEMDPGVAGAALTLLIGTVLVLRGGGRRG